MSDDKEITILPYSWRKDEYGSLKSFQTWKQIFKEVLFSKILPFIFILAVFLTTFTALNIAFLKFQSFGNLIFNLSVLCFSVGGIILAFEDYINKSSELESYHYNKTAHSFLLTGGELLLLHVLSMILSGINAIPQDLKLTTQREVGSTVGKLAATQGWEIALIFISAFILIISAAVSLSFGLLYTFFIVNNTEVLGFDQKEVDTPKGPIKYYHQRLKERTE
jgi:hypothetical protein